MSSLLVVKINLNASFDTSVLGVDGAESSTDADEASTLSHMRRMPRFGKNAGYSRASRIFLSL